MDTYTIVIKKTLCFWLSFTSTADPTQEPTSEYCFFRIKKRQNIIKEFDDINAMIKF